MRDETGTWQEGPHWVAGRRWDPRGRMNMGCIHVTDPGMPAAHRFSRELWFLTFKALPIVIANLSPDTKFIHWNLNFHDLHINRYFEVWMIRPLLRLDGVLKVDLNPVGPVSLNTDTQRRKMGWRHGEKVAVPVRTLQRNILARDMNKSAEGDLSQKLAHMSTSARLSHHLSHALEAKETQWYSLSKLSDLRT